MKTGNRTLLSGMTILSQIAARPAQERSKDYRKIDSRQVKAGKVLTVTGYLQHCQTQEKIGNY